MSQEHCLALEDRYQKDRFLYCHWRRPGGGFVAEPVSGRILPVIESASAAAAMHSVAGNCLSKPRVSRGTPAASAAVQSPQREDSRTGPWCVVAGSPGVAQLSDRAIPTLWFDAAGARPESLGLTVQQIQTSIVPVGNPAAHRLACGPALRTTAVECDNGSTRLHVAIQHCVTPQVPGGAPPRLSHGAAGAGPSAQAHTKLQHVYYPPGTWRRAT